MSGVEFCKKGNLPYTNCDPDNPKFWFQNPVLKNTVRSNIINGCWLCNVEPMQIENNVLCSRALLNVYRNPCKYPTLVNAIRDVQNKNFQTHPIR